MTEITQLQKSHFGLGPGTRGSQTGLGEGREGRRWGGRGEFPSALISVVFMMLLGPLMKEKKKKDGNGLSGGKRQESQIHHITTKSD